jgi:hypothetical protein
MKRLIAQILVNCVLLAALVAAESAYAQTREVYDEVGRDPDPNIRTQLEREHSPGGFDEC